MLITLRGMINKAKSSPNKILLNRQDRFQPNYRWQEQDWFETTITPAHGNLHRQMTSSRNPRSESLICWPKRENIDIELGTELF